MKRIARYLNELRESLTVWSVGPAADVMQSAPELQAAKTWDRKWVPENAIIEPKHDGIRGVIIIDGDDFEAFSRAKKPINNVGHIARELMPSADGFAIDGEFVGKDWASAISAVKSGEKGDTTARFVAFDAMPSGEFMSGKSSRPLKNRLANLKKIVPAGSNYVQVVDGKPVKTPEDVEEAVDKFIEAGYEGGMLKDLDAPYVFKKSDAWAKIKRFKSGDYPIVGFVPGKGKYTGTLGALMVRGPKGKTSGVGSGIPDKLRDEIWSNKDSLYGAVVEIKYQEVTPEGKLRMPVFYRLRPDKPSKEAKKEKRTPRMRALKVFANLQKEFGDSADLLPAGSLRRVEADVKDLDIVPVVRDEQKFLETLDRLLDGKMRGKYMGLKVEIFKPGSNPKFAQWMWTGNKGYRVSMHTRAKAKGFKLNAYGLWKDDKLVTDDIDKTIRLLHTIALDPSEMKGSSPSAKD